MKTTGNTNMMIDMREEMTEAEEAAFNAAAANPSLITTAAHAREILDGLEEDIDAIKEQLEAARLEAEVYCLTDDRQAWVRRATSALVWKKRQHKAVRERLHQILPPGPAPIPYQAPAPAKSMRLLEEEAIRARKADEAAAKLRNAQASNARSVSHATMFVAASKTIISKEQNAQIWKLAREMFPDSPAWLPLSVADGTGA